MPVVNYWMLFYQMCIHQFLLFWSLSSCTSDEKLWTTAVTWHSEIQPSFITDGISDLRTQILSAPPCQRWVLCCALASNLLNHSCAF